MKPVHTDQAPAAIGPYSQAIVHGGVVYASGQIAIVPGVPDLMDGDAATQARQALTNLRAVLEAAGSGLDRVLKATVYLVDMADFPRVNAVYAEFIGDWRPARATVAVAALPAGARVEVDAIAALRD